MKLLLLFATFAVTCVLGVPSCSKDELQKCGNEPYDEKASEEEKLNRDCRKTKCMLDVADRCGIDYFEDRYFPIKGHRKIASTICVKNNPLRRKYLESMPCIRKEFMGPGSKDTVKECGIKHSGREEFCRDIPRGMQCAEDYVASLCGEDAGIVYRIASSPFIDIYDCLQ